MKYIRYIIRCLGILIQIYIKIIITWVKHRQVNDDESISFELIEETHPVVLFLSNYPVIIEMM